MEKRMFEFVNEKSCKFWEIWTDGPSLFTRYGRIGVAGQITEKNYDSDEEAALQAAKIITAKLKKGYVEV